MDLVLNPRVRIRRDEDTLWVQSPRIERGLETHVVSQRHDAALFDLLIAILDADEAVLELDDDALERLAELGVVVPAADAAQDLTYACPLPRATGPATGPLFVHPALAIQRDAELPAPIAALLRGARPPLAPAYPIAWIADPVTGVAVPYVVPARHAAALADLRPGEPAPRDLADDARADLAAAEILVEADFAARREAARRDELEAARERYATRGWAIVRGLLPPAQLAALQGYLRAYVAAGYARRGDVQVPLRWGCHNQHVVTLIHGGLHTLVSRVAGCRTLASYSYFASYMPGAVLGRHRDRAQCKYSVSLQLDATPAGATPWPLCLEDLRGEVGSGLLAPGDGLFYRGCDLTHWRDALPEGRTSTSAFLHYVDPDFEGRLS